MTAHRQRKLVSPQRQLVPEQRRLPGGQHEAEPRPAERAAWPAARPATKYITRTDHSEARIVRGTGYDVHHA